MVVRDIRQAAGALIIGAAFLVVGAGAPATAAEIKVIAGSAVTPVMSQLIATFERSTGHKVRSDFDGAMVPKELGNAAGLPLLVEEMRRRGYKDPLIEKLCTRNWLGVLERTWNQAR